MSARGQLYIAMLVLLLIGGGLTLYKHLSLGFPLRPGQLERIWTVEAKIDFVAEDGPVTASLALPTDTAHLSIVDENIASPWYGFGKQRLGGLETGTWSTRKASGEQTLYYQVDVTRTRSGKNAAPGQPPGKPEPPLLEGRLQTAAESLLKAARTLSADERTFTAVLLRYLGAETPQPIVRTLLNAPEYQGRTSQLAEDLLALEGIAARPVRGLLLGESNRRQKLLTMLEVWTGKQWLPFDVRNGEAGMPANFLPWQHGDGPLLEVEGAKNSRVSFSVLSEVRSALHLAVQRGAAEKAALIDFSIYSLPIEIQNIFRLLLLVPIGALVVVIMRNLVGLRTSGTFMPILIALAFRETELLPGLAIFLLIVSIGLVIRAYLAKLNLLLVPRISAVVIVVIIIMAALSILSYKLGILSGLTVTFFPMIILSWTIERMSVLWEEDGPREVFIQGGGSLIVAICVYGTMGLSLVRHLTFTFPELLLVVLAIILLLGQYTGYRLSELRRFSPMVRD